MRKFLSLFAAVLFAGSMMAAEIQLSFSEGQIDTDYFEGYGCLDLSFYSFADWDSEGYPVGDGQWFQVEFYPESATDFAGTYTIAGNTVDTDYSYLMTVVGTDTTNVKFTDGTLTITVNSVDEENETANIAVEVSLTGEDGNTYTLSTTLDVYYVAPSVGPQFLGVSEVVAAQEAGTLTKGDSLIVYGVVSKIEIKGKNFAKYGSACIYLSDAEGGEGTVELFNCFSLEADTFKTTSPVYDSSSSAWTQHTAVTDVNDVTVNVGDTIYATGNYNYYNSTCQLNQGCYLLYIIPAESSSEGIEETLAEGKAVKVFRNGQVVILKKDQEFNTLGQRVK